MGWIKTELDDNLHEKVKAYRDNTDCQNMDEAAAVLVSRGVVAYESQHGILGGSDE